MFERIGVPLDGSPCAERALPVAARQAQSSSGAVVLLRIVDPRSDLKPYYPSDLGVVQAMVHGEKVAARNYLEGAACGSLLADVQTNTAALCGEPAVRILAAVEAMSIDLLVLCRHNTSAAQCWLPGSLTEQLVLGASVPLLVLGEESASLLVPSRQAGYPFRALVPVDGSDVAQAALAPAAELVAALSSPASGALHLVRVVVLPDARGNGESERSAILHQAWSSLERTVADLRNGLIDPSLGELHLSLSRSVTSDDDIASGICRLAEDGEGSAVPEGGGRTDLIAMATRECGESPRGGAGSLAARVLHTTRLPLLIVPPQYVGHRGHLSRDEAIVA